VYLVNYKLTVYTVIAINRTVNYKQVNTHSETVVIDMLLRDFAMCPNVAILSSSHWN